MVQGMVFKMGLSCLKVFFTVLLIEKYFASCYFDLSSIRSGTAGERRISTRLKMTSNNRITRYMLATADKLIYKRRNAKTFHEIYICSIRAGYL